MLHLVKNNESLGELSLAGSMTRQVSFFFSFCMWFVSGWRTCQKNHDETDDDDEIARTNLRTSTSLYQLDPVTHSSQQYWQASRGDGTKDAFVTEGSLFFENKGYHQRPSNDSESRWTQTTSRSSERVGGIVEGQGAGHEQSVREMRQ